MKLQTGNPTPNITWTKDGSPISRSMGQVTYRKWGIILEDLVPKDSGQYTCTLCNIHGCINFTAKLDVKGKFLLNKKIFKLEINLKTQRRSVSCTSLYQRRFSEKCYNIRKFNGNFSMSDHYGYCCPFNMGKILCV